MTREKAYIQAVNIISNAETGLKNLKQIPCQRKLIPISKMVQIPFPGYLLKIQCSKIGIEKQLAFDEI